MGYNEADTRAKLIESKLYNAGWDVHVLQGNTI